MRTTFQNTHLPVPNAAQFLHLHLLWFKDHLASPDIWVTSNVNFRQLLGIDSHRGRRIFRQCGDWMELLYVHEFL